MLCCFWHTVCFRGFEVATKLMSTRPCEREEWLLRRDWERERWHCFAGDKWINEWKVFHVWLGWWTLLINTIFRYVMMELSVYILANSMYTILLRTLGRVLMFHFSQLIVIDDIHYRFTTLTLTKKHQNMHKTRPPTTTTSYIQYPPPPLLLRWRRDDKQR